MTRRRSARTRSARLARTAAARAEDPEPPEGTEYAPDHVLVRFAAKATPGQQRSSLSALGAEVEGTVDGTGWVQVDVGDQDPAAVVADAGRRPSGRRRAARPRAARRRASRTTPSSALCRTST